eukprot:766913-Hanusia_phi.AAC.1
MGVKHKNRVEVKLRVFNSSRFFETFSPCSLTGLLWKKLAKPEIRFSEEGKGRSLLSVDVETGSTKQIEMMIKFFGDKRAGKAERGDRREGVAGAGRQLSREI